MTPLHKHQHDRKRHRSCSERILKIAFPNQRLGTAFFWRSFSFTNNRNTMMRYKDAQSLEYKAQVPSFIRKMKGERVEEDENADGDVDDIEEVDEFGRSRQKRTEHIEHEEEQDESDPIKALIKDGAQIDNLDVLQTAESPTQQESPKKTSSVGQEGVNFGSQAKKRKTILVDNTSSPQLSTSKQSKKKSKQNKGLLSFE